MKLKNIMIALCIAMCLFKAQMGLCLTPEESFQKSFPQIKFSGMSKTQIPGIYEVVVGSEIIYYSPEAELVISGNIFTKDMKNLTNERRMSMLAQKLKDVPLEKAIKVGNGKISVIEFTDPDCPYCRKASEFFAKRADVTRHVFLLALPMHPNAKDKARYVLCAKDRAKAYEEAMTGKLDDMKFAKCQDATAEETLAAYEKIAADVGIQGTPFFFIKGQTVTGANIPVIENILGSDK
jgi:thiol:disulfide interchange protein DsbC